MTAGSKSISLSQQRVAPACRVAKYVREVMFECSVEHFSYAFARMVKLVDYYRVEAVLVGRESERHDEAGSAKPVKSNDALDV